MKWQMNRGLKAVASITAVVVFSSIAVARSGEVVERVTQTYGSVTVERTITEAPPEAPKREPKQRYACAIFVKNRAASVPDEKVLPLQDLVTSHVTDRGLRIIAREDAINAVSHFADAGPNKGNADLPGATADELLSNNTSALRLAQNMGVDFILNVSITSYGRDTVNFNGAGVHVAAVKHQLRATYQLLDASAGGSLTAGVATVSMTDRIQPGVDIHRDNVLDDLLDGAANDMAAMLGQAVRGGTIEEANAATSRPAEDNRFTIHCGVANMVVPEVVKNDKGEYIVTAGRYLLEPLAVTVELDGVVVGTTPGPFTARPGLHRLRLSRELFKDWERTVNIRNGLELDVALQMSEDGLRQFVGFSDFFGKLKRDQILTEAQAKAMENYSRQIDESHLGKNEVNADGVRVNVNVGRAEPAREAPPTPQREQSPRDPAPRDPAPRDPVLREVPTQVPGSETPKVKPE